MCGVALLALVGQGCDSTSREAEEAEAKRPVPTVDMGESNRRVFEGCDAAEVASSHAPLVGEKVLVTWAWQDADAASAGLEVPAVVLRIDSPRVVVNFDSRVPNLELLTSVWLYSGHITANADGSFGVDPCSASFEKGAW